jgi:hypothetical protein
MLKFCEPGLKRYCVNVLGETRSELVPMQLQFRKICYAINAIRKSQNKRETEIILDFTYIDNVIQMNELAMTTQNPSINTVYTLWR